jgi:hypothetical protein
MYAPRHLVFCGPGRLPAELRAVIAKRTGTPHSDLPVVAPRLLGVFDTAAEAERVAAGLQRLKIGALVAGPEQPAVEDGWTVARTLESFASRWQVTSADGVVSVIEPEHLEAVTVVDWRPENAPVDRAVLLRPRDGERPIFIRASAIDDVSPLATPGRGLQLIGQLLDDCAGALPQDARVRHRKLTPADLAGDLLGIDLLPLAVAMVEALDTQPWDIPRPLSRTASEAPPPSPRAPPLAGIVGWSMYASAIALGPVCLLLLMSGAVLGSLPAIAAGVLAGAVGSRRLGWAHWLAQARWGTHTRLPRWPSGTFERPNPPVFSDLLLDAGLVAALLWGAFSSSPASLLHALLLLPAATVAGLSGLAVWLRSRIDA